MYNRFILVPSVMKVRTSRTVTTFKFSVRCFSQSYILYMDKGKRRATEAEIDEMERNKRPRVTEQDVRRFDSD